MGTITVIATACRANLSYDENEMRNLEARWELDNIGVDNFSYVTGYYQEDGQDEPTNERSMMFTINKDLLTAVTALFCNTYQQDCILQVSDNGAFLRGIDWQEKIGNYLAVVQSTEGLSAYTELFCGTILAVK